MYSIKIEDKPKCCNDCLFCHEVRPVIFMLTRYFCAIKTMALEDKYKLAPWCPILKNKEKPTQLQFSCDIDDEHYIAKGTNNRYDIDLFDNRHDMTLFVGPNAKIIAKKESKTILKYNSKKYKRLLNELIEEAQQYENSCYLPIRAKRKDAK